MGLSIQLIFFGENASKELCVWGKRCNKGSSQEQGGRGGASSWGPDECDLVSVGKMLSCDIDPTHVCNFEFWSECLEGTVRTSTRSRLEPRAGGWSWIQLRPGWAVVSSSSSSSGWWGRIIVSCRLPPSCPSSVGQGGRPSWAPHTGLQRPTADQLVFPALPCLLGGLTFLCSDEARDLLVSRHFDL